VTSAYIGHFALLASLPALLILPLIMIIPKRIFIFSLSIFIFTIFTALIGVDIIVYNQYHFHLNGVILAMLFSHAASEIFDFTWLEYTTLAAGILLILIAEILIAFGTWNLFVKRNLARGWGKWVAVFLFSSFFLSFNMLLYSGNYPIFRYFFTSSRILPLYNNLFIASLRGENISSKMQQLNAINIVQPPLPSKPLHYPLHPLHCSKPGKKFNIVFIIIDSWRFNMLDPSITPHLFNFSKKTLLFKNHVSGGNSTEPGIFTLFYAIPANYWTSTLNQHVRPVLIDELIKANYRIGVFESAHIAGPDFRENVFYGIPNIPKKTPGKTPKDRDITITKAFQKFIVNTKSENSPFFSFLFYDSAHSYCDNNWDAPLKPIITVCNRLTRGSQKDDRLLYFNRYKNALTFIDKEIGKVLQTLRKRDLLKNTIIVITGDHGQQFNDNHLGYWGHASNFTHYQIGTPLIIYWPGKNHHIFTYPTSHFDIAPTLLTQLFGCTNPMSDYSAGMGLFNPHNRPYLIIGSYTNFGVVGKHRIIRIYPTGNYQIGDIKGRPIESARLNIAIIQQVFKDLRRFYR